jgi:predicted nicotinamide N-methyase
MYNAIFFQACFRFRINEAAENRKITPSICIVGDPQRATAKKKRMKQSDVKG